METAQIKRNHMINDSAINGYRIWPFLSTKLFYTNREDYYASKDPDYRKEGIFSYTHSCGFVYNFADKVFKKTGRCVSAVIIQSGDNNSDDPENGNRIDIDLLKHIAGAERPYPLCTRNRNTCILMEDEVANTILEGLYSPEEEITRLKEVLNKHNNTKDNEECFECKSDYVEACYESDHLYYKYNCPISLVGGVMMPIMANRKLVATVIVGQFYWSEEHKKAIESVSRCSCDVDKSSYDLEANNTIIKILFEEVKCLENSLERRLERNAAGLFSAIVNEIHNILSKKQHTNIHEFRLAINEALDFLKQRLSLIEILFFPHDQLTDADGQESSPCGVSSTISKRVKPLNRSHLNNNNYIAKSTNNAVFLTCQSTLHFSLHLFVETDEEECRLSFYHMPTSNGKAITKEEWTTLCNHMETILRELQIQWSLALREEEHSQYYSTMRKFTHELGQKSFSGSFCTDQLHKQIKEHQQNLALKLPDDIHNSEDIYAGIGLLNRTADDLESIFDGIEYLSRLSKAKGCDIKFNPCYYDIRYSTLNSLAAQYRIDIRGRGMKIKYREVKYNCNTLFADKYLAHLAIHNLISNAVKYGHLGTNIYYSCYKGIGNNNKQGVFIDVTDFGVQIPAADRTRIFLDGVRLGHERNDSMGYGLYLTDEIMKRHQGYCEVVESEIISQYALPYLEEMLKLKNRIPKDLHIDILAIQDEYTNAKKHGYYSYVVNKEISVSQTTEPVITMRSILKNGTIPTAKTTIRLFFPEEES